MSILGEKYWGRTIEELTKSRSDLDRWIAANETSAVTFERIGAPVEATIMRNAAKEQMTERCRIDRLIADLEVVA